MKYNKNNKPKWPGCNSCNNNIIAALQARAWPMSAKAKALTGNYTAAGKQSPPACTLNTSPPGYTKITPITNKYKKLPFNMELENTIGAIISNYVPCGDNSISEFSKIICTYRDDNGNYYFRFPRDDFWEKTIVKDYEFAKYIKGKTSFNTVDLKLGHNNDRPFSVHKEIEGVPLAEKMNDLSEKDIEKISQQLAKFMYELHNLPYNESEIFTVNNIGLELHDFITELLEKHVSKEEKVVVKNIVYITLTVTLYIVLCVLAVSLSITSI